MEISYEHLKRFMQEQSYLSEISYELILWALDVDMNTLKVITILRMADKYEAMAKKTIVSHLYKRDLIDIWYEAEKKNINKNRRNIRWISKI
jgi:hypothetical protein